jgi:hypothetical protein
MMNVLEGVPLLYGGPLAKGLVVGETVRCPWHHACFDLRTGALRARALNPIAKYNVVHRDGSIFVGGTREKTPAAHASTRRSETPSAVAIIGGGAAGNRAAEESRRLGFQGAITVFDADESAPYGRPTLSKDYLAGNAPEAWLPLQLSHSRFRGHRDGALLQPSRPHEWSGAGTLRLVRISCQDRCPEDLDARGEGVRTR